MPLSVRILRPKKHGPKNALKDAPSTFENVPKCPKHPRETETAKKAGAAEKDGVLSKNQGFLNFPIFH